MADFSTNPPRADILIVDDTPANLRLLAGILAEQGYKVRPASHGQMALYAAQAQPPDLILLDIMMPDMDGYEVCRHLKADERTRNIPVIFISALDETLDKVTAFTVGGVDYIAKPFQVEEVLARVNTHLTIRRLHRNLEEQIAELDAFAHTVAHDLKTPLGLVIGYADYMLEVLPELGPDELLQHLQKVKQSGQKAISIINELLLLATVRQKEVDIGPLDMAGIIAQSLERLALLLEETRGEIRLPDRWPVAHGYGPWVEEVWTNYISNGLKYGGLPPRLELGASIEPGGIIRFWVQDNGPGLSAEAQQSLFTEFTRLDGIRVEGHGLGLSIVRRIVEKLGGQVGLESQAGQGSLFYFTLPAAEGLA
jgi:two-component system sensor histidine kinase/response regulator